MNQPSPSSHPISVPTAAIILVGGHSSRMGRNKALLPLVDNTTTFVEHLIATLTPFCSQVILVARNSEDTIHYIGISGIQLVIDQLPDHGPLMGIYSGLSAMHTSHGLVVAVDMPCIQPNLLASMLAPPRTSALLLPRVGGFPQVLLGLYPRTVLPLVAAQLQRGRRDPSSLLGRAAVCYIEETELRTVDPELRSFLNVNTMEDYEHIHQLFSSNTSLSLAK